MKKLSIILFSIIILCLCGCENNNNNNNNNNNIELKFDTDKYVLSCEEIKNISDLNFNSPIDAFITKDGEVYFFDLTELFSKNNKSCLKIDTQVKAIKIIGKYIIGDDYKVYELNRSQLVETSDYTILTKIDKNLLPNVFKGMNDYLYYQDKKIYKLDDLGNKELIFNLKDDEELEYFVDDTIKTTKHYYGYSEIITNKEECEKYADIECIRKNEFNVLDKKMENLLNDAIFYKYSSATIVDKNGILYTKAGRGG